ncbi:MAG: acetyl-CoA carboxylase, biotin carboxyl carrier protein [Gammaproteobacteria bacterium]|nr:MAG: acetyl-CoA carboxylase, biotin carboxyl carrier protein [Gammaproteobacteria bacterium]
MSFKYRDVAELLKVVDASDCEELLLEIDGMKLVVRRKGATARVEELSGVSIPTTPLAQGARTLHQNDAPGAPITDGRTGADLEVEKRSDGCIEVRAPMVGTFYTAPTPTDPAFVSKGDQVTPGQPLCLIEVMKLFTTIESTVAGRVKEIVARDQSLVDYGQVLFIIEPDDQH